MRATLSRASEFVELPWPADIELSPEPAERIWQVAGIAPLNPMDQYALLRSRTASELLARLVEDTRGPTSSSPPDGAPACPTPAASPSERPTDRVASAMAS